MYSIHIVTANVTVTFAAEELKKYLRMMMPREGEISIDYDATATDGYRLGLMQDFGLDVSEAPDVELDDIVHIDTDDMGGIIAGDNPRSVLLAVYRFLRANGCRWLFPGVDGEFIPIQKVVGVKYHKMADNRYRGQCNEGAEYQSDMIEAIDFTPKIGMNIFMQEFSIPEVYYNWYYSHELNTKNREPEPVSLDTILQWKRQCETEINKRGLQYHDMGHGWVAEVFGANVVDGQGIHEKLTATEETKPYLPLINGKRDMVHDPQDTNICMSNKNARDIFVSAVVKYAEKYNNVDYLHVWLADGINNHCECEECAKMKPSDWYIILMNELDEKLTEKGLTNRIVFCCYNDTVWPPDTATLNNPERFSLLLGPVSRSYLKSPTVPHIPEIELKPYNRNNNPEVGSVDDYLAYALEWKKRCGVNVIVYEYHFWVNQWYYPDKIEFARLIHNDIKGYKSNGLQGIIEDGSQRSFFPNGFPFYVYGETLFDTDVDFEYLKEDYFSHAYGEDWREVETYFAEVAEKFNKEYLTGRRFDKSLGKYYCPSLVKDFQAVPEIANKILTFTEAHKNMPYRAQTVAVRLLAKYPELLCGLARSLALKALGSEKEARQSFLDFLDDFGKYEVAIERYYDQFLFAYTFLWRHFRVRGYKFPEQDEFVGGY